MINWSRYLESLCNAYAQWWQIYTITDVVGQKRVESKPSPLLFDFGLMVQTVERDREERGEGEKKVERLSILEGLHKYASEHVLLVGRPGSGKSTALVRLVLEEAQKANLTPPTPLPCEGRGEQDFPLNYSEERGRGELEDSPLLAGEGQGERSTKGHGNQPKIPVLVELRYYRTSILDLIQDFLQRHDPNLTVDTETLKSWLRQGQLLLLLDGLNELPSEEARRELHKLRQDYQKTTPMIFTTRDLGVGGDLDIAKKLEMQPLSEAQMQQFISAYLPQHLPQQVKQMLKQLGSRSREFGQTPLLLWMLCSLFGAMGRVPLNLGSVFRLFTQIYTNKLKQDIPISEESRRWWHRLLEQLAKVMTCGKEKTQLQVAIPRQQAEAVLTEFLAGKVAHPEDCAICWLEDLLKHHLIQLGAGDRIEFRHQLIQEYYTAEYLLKLLPSLSDDELKREYLNYLKWTEPLVLMLDLVEDRVQAARVVKLALEVDWWLGARLAGSVKPEFQEQTVDLVAALEIPQLLKIQLLGRTKSDKAIFRLYKSLEDEDSDLRINAAYTLNKIDNQETIEVLVKALKNKDYYVFYLVGNTIDKIGNLGTIDTLGKALKHKDFFVRRFAIEALTEIGSAEATEALVEAFRFGVGNRDQGLLAEALGKIGNAAAVDALIEFIIGPSGNSFTLMKAAEALGRIRNPAAINALTKALEHESYIVHRSAANALNLIDRVAESAV